MIQFDEEDAKSATLITMHIWVLQHVRENPAISTEDIVVDLNKRFGDQVASLKPLVVKLWLDSYEAAGFIRHDHMGDVCVWLHVDPKPVPKSGQQHVTIETAGTRYNVYTAQGTKALAKAWMEALRDEDEAEVLLFNDITGKPQFIVRATEISALAFGGEVAAALVQ